MADRSPRPVRLFAGFAWTGAAAASAMFLVTGDNWKLGVLLLIMGNLCLVSSLVIYDSLLCRIAEPDDRDRVSSRGWAWGYLGGGLLLALNLGLLKLAPQIGMSQETAVRISLLSAGLWWATFTTIPVVGLRGLRGPIETATGGRAGVVSGSLIQLASTFRDLRSYPQTLLFLLAYLFFNDGIQTVVKASSIYGAEELKFNVSQLTEIILLVQFVSIGGALLFGRLAKRFGAWRMVLYGLMIWTVVVTIAFFVPAGGFSTFVGLAVLIGIVLGGTQALSRSMYSQLIPRGREAEFFSLYQAMERGTSWFGTLLFGLVHQLTDSYRWAIIALIVFFAVGGALLSRVRMREGIQAAGNQVPAVI
jgi:UMF1 family MFS transporter